MAAESGELQALVLRWAKWDDSICSNWLHQLQKQNIRNLQDLVNVRANDGGWEGLLEMIDRDLRRNLRKWYRRNHFKKEVLEKLSKGNYRNVEDACSDISELSPDYDMYVGALKSISQVIESAFGSSTLILRGSLANGTALYDSDIDIDLIFREHPLYSNRTYTTEDWMRFVKNVGEFIDRRIGQRNGEVTRSLKYHVDGIEVEIFPKIVKGGNTWSLSTGTCEGDRHFGTSVEVPNNVLPLEYQLQRFNRETNQTASMLLKVWKSHQRKEVQKYCKSFMIFLSDDCGQSLHNVLLSKLSSLKSGFRWFGDREDTTRMQKICLPQFNSDSALGTNAELSWCEIDSLSNCVREDVREALGQLHDDILPGPDSHSQD